MVSVVLDFYRGKRVFITGHTGFKGSWLCTILYMAGAEVTGFALPPEEVSLCRIIGLEQDIHSINGDIRDYSSLWRAFNEAQPEIVFHMAAQPIVREPGGDLPYQCDGNGTYSGMRAPIELCTKFSQHHNGQGLPKCSVAVGLS